MDSRLCNMFAAIDGLTGLMKRAVRLTLALVAALAAAPALAAEPQAADQPVATADAQGAVAAQIDDWIKSSPAAEGRADAMAANDDAVPDRKPHGVVSVGVGTHGYRSVYARTDLPLGESGRLSIAVADTRFGGRIGRPYLGEPAFAAANAQRCDLEGMTPARPLDVAGGPNGRCVDRLPGW